jgi:hypothetical protein
MKEDSVPEKKRSQAVLLIFLLPEFRDTWAMNDRLEYLRTPRRS